MTDERLAEIEASIDEDAIEVIQHPDSFYSRDYMDRAIGERRWLLARVRALEAQAERDAEVREAAVALREAVRGLSVHVHFVETEESKMKYTGWAELRVAVAAYDAALAAREAGKEE